jgi:hypothetical protein
LTHTGWFEDPENPKRLRYKLDGKWTLRVRYHSGTVDEYETELSPPLKRGSVKIDSSAHEEPRQIPVIPDVITNQIPYRQESSTYGAKLARKWLLGISISIAIFYLFSSCQPSGWQMGVDGNGTRVECNDGTWSNSGGLPGACSWHDGVK